MRKCSLCEEEEAWAINYSKQRDMIDYAESIGIKNLPVWYLCKKCGNAYPYPQTDKRIIKQYWENARLPENAYSEKLITTLYANSEKIYNVFKGLIENKSSALDIGCGYGALLKVFKDKGWRTFGIDPDPTTKIVHEKLGIDTIIEQVETYRFSDRYDVVISNYAIYFISDVKSFLIDIKNNISVDGYLCIVLADFLSYREISLPGYAHSFYPTQSSMEYLLKLCGYRIELSVKKMGSIYIAAKVEDNHVLLEKKNKKMMRTYLLYKTKKIRNLLFGKLFMYAYGKYKQLIK